MTGGYYLKGDLFTRIRNGAEKFESRPLDKATIASAGLEVGVLFGLEGLMMRRWNGLHELTAGAERQSMARVLNSQNPGKETRNGDTAFVQVDPERCMEYVV